MQKKPSEPSYRDKTLKGIEIRTNKQGIKRYRVRIRKKNQSEISQTYRTAALAQKHKNRIENAIEEGRYQFERKDKENFNSLVKRYLEVILPQNPKNASNKQRHLLWWKRKFGHYLLQDIKPSLIALARDELLSTTTRSGTYLAPATVVRYLSSLSHAFSIAVKEWEWLKENPVLKIKKPKEANGRLRFLSIEEKDRLLSACKQSQSKDLYLIVALAICTGMRKGEILNLKWKNIDIDREAIWLEDTKNGERRFVPLLGIPNDLLSKKYQNQQLDSLIFPSTKADRKPIDIRSAWEKALHKANIKNFVFHSLRHTTASYLAMEHVSLIEIAALLGHKTLQTTKRYAHLSDKHLHQTAEKILSKIF